MIIDALYDLSVALADPDVHLNELLRDWRGLDDADLEDSTTSIPTWPSPSGLSPSCV